MTKKDYVAMAAAVQYGRVRRLPTDDAAQFSVNQSTCELIARALADVCAKDNPRFDRSRFLCGCGVTN